MRWLPLLLIAGLLLPGCGPEDDYDPETPWVEGELGTWRAGLSVAEAGGCSTGIVAGLSRQLIAEVNCLRPNTLTDFSGANIVAGDVVWPFLQPGGTTGLRAAVRARGQNIRINSALRTLAQQYLLYRWWQEGRCNIGLAARPGHSNHESGLALDIEDNAGWRASLQAQSFQWFGADDPVHFDYRGAGTVALSGLSILAFQRLWNRNHRGDLIDEDGLYGPQTEARLRASPTDGFAIGACPAEPPPPPPVDAAPPPPPPPVDAAPPPPPPVDAARPPPPPPRDAGPILDARPPDEEPEPLDAEPVAEMPPETPPEAPDGGFEPDFAGTFAPESPDARPPLPAPAEGRQSAEARFTGTGGCTLTPGAPADSNGTGAWALLILALGRRRRRARA